MKKENKKIILVKYGKILSYVYRLIKGNTYRVRGGNNFMIKGVYAAHCHFNISGKDNTIEIIPGITRMNNCSITIKGCNCKVHIGKDSNLNNCHLYIEDDGGEIFIGKHVTVTGQTNLAVIEGKKIIIGEDCLFSSEISFRVGDSHSILDKETRKRINPSADISIGNHVWIGHSAKVLKGAVVGKNSIIATGAIVTGKHFPNNSIIGGIPGKVLKEGVEWCAERL